MVSRRVNMGMRIVMGMVRERIVRMAGREDIIIVGIV